MKYVWGVPIMGVLVLPTLFALRNPFQAPAAVPAVNAIPARTADCESATGLARVICRTEAFKATLTDEQLAMAQLPYSKANAQKWSNFPEFGGRPLRIGIRLGLLNAAQLKAAKTLMAAVLRQNILNEGYDEPEGNLAADTYFGMTTGKTGIFSAGNYFIAFLGTPSLTGLWELEFGGHHYAFANTYNAGKITGVTPSFRGVEPMSAVTINGLTYQPVEQERQAFSQLLTGLSNREQTKARLSTTFRDILLGPGRDGQFPATKQGLRVGDLSAAKQALVLTAIKLYVNDLDPATSAPILASYTKGLSDTYIAYSGSESMSQSGDYIRTDGPILWIEYSAQPSRDFLGTTHPHSVWRDRTGDYGGN